MVSKKSTKPKTSGARAERAPVQVADDKSHGQPDRRMESRYGFVSGDVMDDVGNIYVFISASHKVEFGQYVGPTRELEWVPIPRGALPLAFVDAEILVAARNNLFPMSENGPGIKAANLGHVIDGVARLRSLTIKREAAAQS